MGHSSFNISMAVLHALERTTPSLAIFGHCFGIESDFCILIDLGWIKLGSYVYRDNNQRLNLDLLLVAKYEKSVRNSNMRLSDFVI